MSSSPSVFPLTPLSELLSNVVDNRGRTCPTAQEGIPLIATNCITNHSIFPVFSKVRYVSQETYDTWFRQHPLPGDIVLVNKGSPGNVALVPDPVTFCFAQDMVAIRPIESIDNFFLFAALKSAQVRAQVENIQVGTTIPHFKKSDFDKLLIPVPPLPAQKAIGLLHYRLGLKVETNRRISENLESIAQTLFRSWFVDFDPVRAKMAGEKPAGMDEATAALFPDSMEDTELGEIPAGWSVSPLTAICDRVVNGSTPLRSNPEYWTAGEIPWFKTGELADGFLLKSSEKITEKALIETSVKILPKGSVLVAIYAAPTVGRLGILTNDATFNQACTGLTPSNLFGTGFIFLALQAKRVYFNSLAIGAAQQNISKQIVEQAPIVIATAEVQSQFKEIVAPIFDQIESLTRQNENLAAIRDSLLPRLISGELEVPEDLLVS